MKRRISSESANTLGEGKRPRWKTRNLLRAKERQNQLSPQAVDALLGYRSGPFGIDTRRRALGPSDRPCHHEWNRAGITVSRVIHHPPTSQLITKPS
ncbi:MAG: hypothetical protein AB7G75_04195 [Candidatus Binatia bacterium]